MTRALRKIKRTMKKNKSITSIVIVVLFLIVLIAILKLPTGTEPAATTLEITEIDVLSLDEFHARAISVYGLQLGQTQRDVLDKLGPEDNKQEYPPNIVNLEYGESIGLEDLGLIFHFNKDVLTRITFREQFNDNLHGATKINHTKEDIYFMFGAPQKTTFLPTSDGAASVVRNMVYAEQNMEIYVRKGDVIGIGFVL